ncbi:MAG TPA: hypothetical protein PLF13_07940 [candidate division Zixibacteria bacterium]|nr:hypothetical protein [candidate division Zixibacteria bacterium]
MPLLVLMLALSACRKPTGVSADCAFDAGMIIPAPVYTYDLVPNGPFPGDRSNNSRILTVVLDNSGNVTGLESDESADSAWVRYLGPSLSGYRFTPPPTAPFKLAAIARYSKGREQFSFSFPVDSTCRAVDQDLVNMTLHLNGFEPAGIRSFPKYSCDLGPDNPNRSRRFILFRLALDSAGRCSEASLVSTDYPAFVGQLTSAVLYAEFEPARFEGRAIESHPYLLVSFYPSNRRPMLPFNDSTEALMSFHERRALTILNDTSGIIIKPIPRIVPYDTLSVMGHSAFHKYSLTLPLHIDSMGTVVLTNWKGIPKLDRNTIKEILTSMKFFPALDVEGRPREYEGLVTLEFLGNRRVKLMYHWLQVG